MKQSTMIQGTMSRAVLLAGLGLAALWLLGRIKPVPATITSVAARLQVATLDGNTVEIPLTPGGNETITVPAGLLSFSLDWEVQQGSTPVSYGHVQANLGLLPWVIASQPEIALGPGESVQIELQGERDVAPGTYALIGSLYANGSPVMILNGTLVVE